MENDDADEGRKEVTRGKMNTIIKVKSIVPLVVSGIVLIAQIFHSVNVIGNYSKLILPMFMSYSLIAGSIVYFIIDFISASGNLRRKIQYVKLITMYLVLLLVTNRVFKPIAANYKIQFLLTTLILMIIILVDIFYKRGRDYDFICETAPLPKSYLRTHPVRTILETIFRLFPAPVPVALYKVGKPDENSPVIITGNYDLTVRRVAKVIQNLNCRLLICDSRGINVWCSALSGHFSEKSIIQAVKLTHLSEYISHKRLILPQLCAAGVDLEKIREETGFRAVFGPVYIEHIKEFLNSRHSEARIRKVEFDLMQRLEMAVGSPIILVILIVFIYLFIDISKLSFILPAVYFFAVAQAIIYPFRLFKRTVYWALVYSICVTTVLIIVKNIIPGIATGDIITIGIGIFYLVNEFEGWSPLLKYNLKSMYKSPAVPEIRVDTALCNGCRLCFQVCPKSVFSIENGKAMVVNKAECINCTACYKRCPPEAIVHSFDNREKAECGCVYCRVADSINE